MRFGGKYQECRESVNFLPNLFPFLSFFIHFLVNRAISSDHKLQQLSTNCLYAHLHYSGFFWAPFKKQKAIVPSAFSRALQCNTAVPLLLPPQIQTQPLHLSTHCITKTKSRRETEAALQHKCHADSTSCRTVPFTW